jgi:hypothetical protein
MSENDDFVDKGVIDDLPDDVLGELRVAYEQLAVAVPEASAGVTVGAVARRAEALQKLRLLGVSRPILADLSGLDEAEVAGLTRGVRPHRLIEAHQAGGFVLMLHMTAGRRPGSA